MRAFIARSIQDNLQTETPPVRIPTKSAGDSGLMSATYSD
jgi:hypothetical protein